MGILLIGRFRDKSHSRAKIFKLAGTDIGSHYYYGVLKIHFTPERVSKTSFIEHLKKKVEHIGVSFLNLIKKNH